jgi:hypothetical protein
MDMADFTSEKQYSYNSLEDRLIKGYFAETVQGKKNALRLVEDVGVYVAPFVGGILAGIFHGGQSLDTYQLAFLFSGPSILAGVAKGYQAHLRRKTLEVVLHNEESRRDLLQSMRDDPDKFKKIRKMQEQIEESSIPNEVGIALAKAVTISIGGYAIGMYLRRFM